MRDLDRPDRSRWAPRFGARGLVQGMPGRGVGAGDWEIEFGAFCVCDGFHSAHVLAPPPKRFRNHILVADVGLQHPGVLVPLENRGGSATSLRPLRCIKRKKLEAF